MIKRIFLFFLLVILLALWFLNLDFFNFFKELKEKEKSFNQLKLENEILKQKLNLKNSNLNENKNYVLAYIYFQYPFNFQSKISLALLNKEELFKIKENAPILVEKNLLLGKVLKVENERIIGLTIFDKDWKSSVLIGDKKVKALLNGGYEPILTLIDKSDLPNVGDLIINADENLPYGLILGKVKELIVNPAEVWATAKIELLFNYNYLREVLIYAPSY